jgi:hypothetical protein
MGKHAFIVRTSLEDDGLWAALAEAVPEIIATATVAGGDIPGVEAARRDRPLSLWACECSHGATESEAVTAVVAKLLVRGLDGRRG